MNNKVYEIVDTPEKLEEKIASVKAAQKIFATYTQEQVDKIFLAAASAANKAAIINFFKYSLDIIISPLFINKFLFPSYIAFEYKKRINFRQKYKTRLSKGTENTNILLPDPV